VNRAGHAVDHWSVVNVAVKNGGGGRYVSTHSHAFMSGTGTSLNHMTKSNGQSVGDGVALAVGRFTEGQFGCDMMWKTKG